MLNGFFSQTEVDAQNAMSLGFQSSAWLCTLMQQCVSLCPVLLLAAETMSQSRCPDTKVDLHFCIPWRF